MSAATDGDGPSPVGVGRVSEQTRQLGVLLDGASRGDEVAFAALYDATSARVFGLARRILRTWAQAEEVTQEAYLEIWRTSTRFDRRRGSALAWMLTIVRRRAIDRVRSEQARTRREDKQDREGPLGGPAHDPTGDSVVSTSEGARVLAALAELTAPQREALELAYFGGLTHSEVAERTGVPLGTAKSRLRDGLIRLRDVMTAQDDPGGVRCRPDARPARLVQVWPPLFSDDAVHPDARRR